MDAYSTLVLIKRISLSFNGHRAVQVIGAIGTACSLAQYFTLFMQDVSQS